MHFATAEVRSSQFDALIKVPPKRHTYATALTSVIWTELLVWDISRRQNIWACGMLF